jgi:hypothetical protein
MQIHRGTDWRSFLRTIGVRRVWTEMRGKKSSLALVSEL